MPDRDEITDAAKQIVDALSLEGPEERKALRYLFARVALDQGLLTLIAEEARPSGTLLICQEPTTGLPYRAERPSSWTNAAEGQYLGEVLTHLR